jgi:signal transduction histidine kinase
MFVLLIALWASSAFLYASDPKDESFRWLSISTFCSGCGALGVILKEQIIPTTGHNPSLHFGLLVFTGVLFSFSINWGPYIYLMFGISYSELFGNKWPAVWKNRLFWLGMIPPASMNVLYGILPSYEPSYRVMSIWVVLFEGAATFFLFYAFILEKDIKMKQQRLLTVAVLSPIALFSVMTNYVLHIWGINDLWRYSPWLACFLAVYIILYIKYGFLGVKLKFEKQHLYSTRVITSGISILSHTLNNGLSKIAVKTEEITRNSRENKENAQFILNSVNHMFAMLDKIKTQIKELVFEERTIRFIELIDSTLLMILPFFGEKKITVRKHFSHDIEILGDPAHLKELLINLCKNAIEAVKSSGELTFELSLNRNRPVLIIRDTGAGIPQEKLARIGEPFWTTKDSDRNYGLGLWYCRRVMDHYGKLELFSEENIGTSVYLYFSKIKVVKTAPIPTSGGEFHGLDKIS